VAARVVYVDTDPVTAAVAEQLLAAEEQAAAVHADLRCPARVLAAPACRRLLDFDRPVAVLLTGVLHLLPDDPGGIVAGYRQVMAPGSCLLLSHATEDRLGGQPPDGWGAWNTWPRSGGQVGALFAGFDLLWPGLVRTGHWRPQDPREQDPVRWPTWPASPAAGERQPGAWTTTPAAATAARAPLAGNQ
jgi:S-adenosyl methyltransferase